MDRLARPAAAAPLSGLDAGHMDAFSPRHWARVRFCVVAVALTLAGVACSVSDDANLGQQESWESPELGHQDAPLQEGQPAGADGPRALAEVQPARQVAAPLPPPPNEAPLPIRFPGEVLTPPATPADFCTAAWIFHDDAEGEAAADRAQQEEQHFAALAQQAQTDNVAPEPPATEADAEADGGGRPADDLADADADAARPDLTPAPFGALPEPDSLGFDPAVIFGDGAPRLMVSEPAGPRYFDNVDHAAKPKLFACFRAANYFPALAERYDALGRCSVEESKKAVERFGAGSFVVCKDATFAGCSFLGEAERFHFNYTRELWRPTPRARNARPGPIGGGMYVVLSPERTLQLAAPLAAWRASPPGLRRDQLPSWAQPTARCLSCDQLGAENLAEAGRRGRCLEEHAVAIDRLAEAVGRRHPQAAEVVVRKTRELYLQTPQQWRVLHRPDQAFLPRPWEAQDATLQLLEGADLPQRNLAHLSMCVALTRQDVHPGRIAAHAANCLERAEALLSADVWAALAPDFTAAFAAVPQAGVRDGAAQEVAP